MAEKPVVGVGVIILNNKSEILVAKRRGSHAASKWSIPGGGLEMGESFEECAIREVQEEHGITVTDPSVIAITNNLETYRAEGFHSISVVLLAKAFEGEPAILEPHKCEEMAWADPTSLPQPHYDASRLAIECYLNGEVSASSE